MAEDTEAAYKAANHTAFVLGYTGEVGKELVKVGTCLGLLMQPVIMPDGSTH